MQNEHAYDVEVEVNNKHPYEAFAYHLEASSSTPTCIHRKYSSSEEALFAFLPLREDLDELRGIYQYCNNFALLL